jgi:ElaB/YqjD/DUF883 family membrane-anchored ribosome-binding protein
VTNQPVSASEPVSASASESQTSPAAQLSARVDERPELAVGGAFAGGLVLGLLLKRLAR